MNEARIDLTIRHRLVFCAGLVISFFVGPVLTAALQIWLGPLRAADASVLVSVAWIAAFLLAGAMAGGAVAGPRGRIAFLLAFATMPIVVVLILSPGFAVHDNVHWRRYERALDVLLFSVGYPLMFGIMGSVGVAVASRSWKKARAAAAACAIRGAIGGVIFCIGIIVFPLRGYTELVAFIVSLGLPSYLCSRPIHTLMEEQRV